MSQTTTKDFVVICSGSDASHRGCCSTHPSFLWLSGQAGFSEALNVGKGGGGMERSWEGWPKGGRRRGVSLQRMPK